MRLPMLGSFCPRKTLLILTLVHSFRAFQSDEINVSNLCNRSHCEDCSPVEFFKCADGANSIRCGDLCGCCQSCVKLRGVGESCDTQLAIRSLKYVERGALATTRCKKGLICKNFMCHQPDDKRFHDAAEREKNCTVESSERIQLPKHQIYRKRNENSEHGNVSFNPLRRLTKLFVGEGELQLIHGDEGLEDLNVLLPLIDENQVKLIIGEYEAKFFNENLIKGFDKLEMRTVKLSDGKIDSKFMILEKLNKKFYDALKKTRMLEAFRKMFEKNVDSSKPRFVMKKNRNKRESIKTNREDKKTSIYDIVNKTPREYHHSTLPTIGKKNSSKSNETLTIDETPSEINIRITGVPEIANFSARENKTNENTNETKNFQNYDEPKISDSDADFSTIVTEERNLSNIENPEILKTAKIYKIYDDENSKNVSSSDEAQYFKYEFTFPENPIILENGDVSYVDPVVSENELKAQLDRIETRAIVIENAIFDVMRKIDEKQSQENQETDIKYTNNQNYKFPENFQHRPTETTDSLMKNISPLEKKFEKNTTIGDSDLSANKFSRSFAFPKNFKFPKNEYTSVKFPENQFSKSVEFQKNFERLKNIEALMNREFSKSTKIENFNSVNPKSTLQPEMMTSRRAKETISRQVFDQRGQSFEEPIVLKFVKAQPKQISEQRKPLIFTSKRERKNFDRNADPRLFERSRFGGNFPQRRRAWPLNLILNRAVAGRGDRETEEDIRIPEKNYPLENKKEKSTIRLETQIPRSVRTRDSSIVDDRGSSIFVSKYDNGYDDWLERDEQPRLNLFFLEGQDPESENSDKNYFDDNKEIKEDHKIDDPFFPKYLDYVEKSGVKKEKDGINKSEASVNVKKNESQISEHKIKKREIVNFDERIANETEKVSNLSNEKHEKIEILENEISSKISNELESEIRKENSTKNVTPNRSRPGLGTYWPKNETNDFRFDKTKGKNSNTLIDDSTVEIIFPRLKTRETSSPQNSEKRKRSVRVVDWLRAAQEYNERLREMRNAAVKTWLASREILGDSNLTNVKLFTRELPSNVEKYESIFLPGHFEEQSSPEIRNAKKEDSMTDASEILTDIFVEDSLPRRKSVKIEEPETRRESRYSKISSSVEPRKFTIITNGSSTIRIEDLSKDETTESSSTSEIVYDLTIDEKNDGDHFDHMYEGFESEDDDFDYEELNSTNEFYEASIEDENKEDKSVEKERDISSRLKRDSPLVLFKADGNPRQDVRVWPSNWKDLVDRHLRFGGSAPRKTNNRRSYVKLGKSDHKLFASSYGYLTKEKLENEE